MTDFEQTDRALTNLSRKYTDLEAELAELRQYVADQNARYGRLLEQAVQLRQELIDITARSIAGRTEAWDLIDRLIPFAKGVLGPNDTWAYTQLTELLTEIEEKRKGHG